jgi:hypothetical protein
MIPRTMMPTMIADVIAAGMRPTAVRMMPRIMMPMRIVDGMTG